MAHPRNNESVLTETDTFANFVKDAKNTALLACLPHDHATITRAIEDAINGNAIYPHIILVGSTRYEGRPVQIYGCMSKTPRPGDQLPALTFNVMGSDSRLSDRISGEEIIGDEGFGYHFIFGTSRPSRQRLSYAPKYYLLRHYLQADEKASALTKVTRNFKIEMIQLSKEFQSRDQAAQYERRLSLRTAPSPSGSGAFTSVSSGAQQPSSSQVTGGTLDHTIHINRNGDTSTSNTSFAVTPANQNGDITQSSHSACDTQDFGFATNSLIDILTAKVKVIDKIHLAEKKDDSLKEKMKTMQIELEKIEAMREDLNIRLHVIQEERNKLAREADCDKQLYDSVKKEEEAICASMPSDARSRYEMVQKASVEGDRLEKRHKHDV